MKRLIKIATGVSAAASGLYWASAPIFAGTGDLCPTDVGFNPLCNNKWDANTVISTGINVLLFVAFVAALGFLIIGGIRWIISGGDKEGTAKAKSTVTSALIGLVVVLAAWILLNVILGFFGLGNISTFKLPTLPK